MSAQQRLPGLIDTHCHLDAAEFDGDRQAVLARALGQGVAAMVVPAVERSNFEAVARLADEMPACVAAYGIHPLCVGAAEEGDLDVLRERLRTRACVAVGEIGLDFFIDGHDRARQEWYFGEQLKIARAFGLPVLLHVRRAQDVILKHLRLIGVPGGIAHAFNGSMQQAEAFIGLGFKLGFGGAMTYDRATRLRELAGRLPLDAIVLETDAPDIPPVWSANRRSEPADVAQIARALAVLRGIGDEEVAAVTTENACRVLPRLGERLLGDCE